MSKRIKVEIPPERFPFNIMVLMNPGVAGWGNDHREIVRVYSAYRHRFVSLNGWHGFALNSQEFVQGVLSGHRNPSRSIGTQTLATCVDPDFVQIRSPE